MTACFTPTSVVTSDQKVLDFLIKSWYNRLTGENMFKRSVQIDHLGEVYTSLKRLVVPFVLYDSEMSEYLHYSDGYVYGWDKCNFTHASKFPEWVGVDLVEEVPVEYREFVHEISRRISMIRRSTILDKDMDDFLSALRRAGFKYVVRLEYLHLPGVYRDGSFYGWSEDKNCVMDPIKSGTFTVEVYEYQYGIPIFEYRLIEKITKGLGGGDCDGLPRM